MYGIRARSPHSPSTTSVPLFGLRFSRNHIFSLHHHRPTTTASCSQKANISLGRACLLFGGCVDLTSRTSLCRHQRTRTIQQWRRLESPRQRYNSQDRQRRRAHCLRRVAHRETQSPPSRPRYPLSFSPLALAAHRVRAKPNTALCPTSQTESCTIRLMV